jgi:RNA polymerase sigma factor (TIGR02999 family)
VYDNQAAIAVRRSLRINADLAAAMINVTQILSKIETGDPKAAEQLLPLVYDELRRLAAYRLAHEKPGQTLQCTALVHEAYLRIVDGSKPTQWNSRGHFFAAAAEAMRRILVENARRKKSQKHGGDMRRVALDNVQPASPESPDQLLEIDEALAELERHDAEAGRIFKLRYFAGCSLEEGAEILGVSRATAYRHWTFARAWILKHLLPGDGRAD